MGKIIETTINKFDGGIVNDKRDTRKNVCRMVTSFDILTDESKMTPYRSSEDGDSSSATRKQQNFAVVGAKLYALGVQSGAADAEVLGKDILLSGTNSFADANWADTSGVNQQTSGTIVSFNLFTYYKNQDLIFSARDSRHIQAFSPSGSAWNN